VAKPLARHDILREEVWEEVWEEGWEEVWEAVCVPAAVAPCTDAEEGARWLWRRLAMHAPCAEERRRNREGGQEGGGARGENEERKEL
jgi:hypothetical protein